jgi:hypothetical protein
VPRFRIFLKGTLKQLGIVSAVNKEQALQLFARERLEVQEEPKIKLSPAMAIPTKKP